MTCQPHGFKALIFDIDGTLLTSQGTMTYATYSALHTCCKKGYVISVATARAANNVFRTQDIPWDCRFLKEKGVFSYGATVFDLHHSFCQNTAIPASLVHEVVEFLITVPHAFQIVLEYDSLFYSFRYPLSTHDRESWGITEEEIIDFRNARQKPVTKIVVFDSIAQNNIYADVTVLSENIATTFSQSLTSMVTDSKVCLALVAKQVNKADAVETLLNQYDIKLSETVVFGDDLPDLSLFDRCGFSVAMGNAQDVLKSKASFVTYTNDHDGVVFALQNYLHII